MLVLASASLRRHELLQTLGVEFVVDAADVDESLPEERSPRATATELARLKACTVAARRADGHPVLAADTVVVTSLGAMLGKPDDAADAGRMLRALAGTTQSVITGVCLVTGAAVQSGVVETRVTMRPLSAEEIETYVASGEPFGKAGGYAIQETGDQFVTAVEGSWSNVVGLPLERVSEMLRTAGIGAMHDEVK